MNFFRILKLLARRKPFLHFLRRGFWTGECPICGGSAIFYLEGDYRRDQLRCLDCYSIPRWRAVMDLLRTRYPDWKNLKIHESSASGPVYHLFMRECNGYQASQFFEGGARGEVYQGFRCEDLGNQTFPDESFDLVITQDVLEHLPDPESAFREIARTLKPGGAHLFTVPWYRGTKTRARAKFHENGKVEHLLPPQYHGNPVDPCGSLVVTDWGDDMLQVIFDSSGMTTEVFDAVQLGKGIDGEFREVFLSLKPNEGRSSKP